MVVLVCARLHLLGSKAVPEAALNWQDVLEDVDDRVPSPILSTWACSTQSRSDCSAIRGAQDTTLYEGFPVSFIMQEGEDGTHPGYPSAKEVKGPIKLPC